MMKRLRFPSLSLVKAMEALVALAVLSAFWSWRLRSNYVEPRLLYLTLVVTGISVFVIASALSGVTERDQPRLNR